MSNDEDSTGCLILIILFFMALRGCNYAGENEVKINKLENKVESLDSEVESLESEIDRMRNR